MIAVYKFELMGARIHQNVLILNVAWNHLFLGQKSLGERWMGFFGKLIYDTSAEQNATKVELHHKSIMNQNKKCLVLSNVLN